MTRKKQYRIRNWKEYNKALVNRGSLTVWFDEESIADWHEIEPTGKKGRPFTYTDIAIRCGLTLRYLFRQSLRATKGLIRSLIQLLKLPISAPDYSTLSRRQKDLDLPKFTNNNKPMHLVVDSTGIKIYGEGEWKMRQHGKEKRRTWRKLHLAVDEATHQIAMCVVTHDNKHDCKQLPKLLSPLKDLEITQVTGDGAYDTKGCYRAVLKAKAMPCFPPRVVAVRHKPTNKGIKLRNQAIGYLREGKLNKWKEKTNYHRRNIAETAMSRIKKIFGDKAASRLFKNQMVELNLRCHILNKMTSLGMPDTVSV